MIKCSTPQAGVLVALTLLGTACGDELGDCDRVPAEELVYSDSGMVATKGQALIHDSCGQGAYCHSAAAEGDARRGAPAALNFDMLPIPTGWTQLIQHRDKVWEQIKAGHMPPKNAGDAVASSGWLFDVRRADGTPELPSLQSSDGKGALRNWLACGAPLVSETQTPLWARPPSCEGSGDADFDALYASVLRPYCASACHNLSAAGGLNMSDACSAFEALKQSGHCGVRLRPGDESSPLLVQLESRSPRCGAPMPPAALLPSGAVAAVRHYIQGATDSSDN